MKSQVKAFQISFLLHGVLLVAAFLLSTQIGPSKNLTTLDFTLHKPEPTIKKIEPPVPDPIKKESKPKEIPTPKKNESPKQTEENPANAPASDIAPAIKLPEAQSLGGPSLGLGMVPSSKSIKEGSPGTVGGSKEGSGTGLSGGNADTGKESAKTKYLKEHFSYIRDKILSHITYPPLAYRMGWQGKVLVSFIVTADGSVREVKVIQSSGFAILDENAIEAVKDTAPFPKPPVEAKLTIPILYRLD